MDDMTRVWKEECLVRADLTYLNCGTLAPTLRSVLKGVEDTYREWMKRGPGAGLGFPDADGYFDMMRLVDSARQAVAQWMKTDPRSVAITGNATDGVNMALTSLRWHPGDRVLTTTHEHEALRYPLSQLHEQYGIEVDVIEFPDEGQEDVLAQQMTAALHSRTRLIAMSSRSHRSGVALDMEKVLSQVVRSTSVYVLVDGAHAAGTTVDLLTEGIDFYAFPCHKWLFAPAGTGVLWVSDRALQETDGVLWGAPTINLDKERYDNRDGAWRYEYGTRDWTRAKGIEEAIHFRQQWSEEAIINHYRTLTNDFLRGYHGAGCEIAALGGGPILSLTTRHALNIAERLWKEQRILTKTSETGLRLSIPPWLTSSEAHDVGTTVGRVIREES